LACRRSITVIHLFSCFLNCKWSGIHFIWDKIYFIVHNNAFTFYMLTILEPNAVKWLMLTKFLKN
ncbi:hypothetical protein X975_07133, partial [Stegodyphus mimosarum]